MKFLLAALFSSLPLKLLDSMIHIIEYINMSMVLPNHHLFGKNRANNNIFSRFESKVHSVSLYFLFIS